MKTQRLITKIVSGGQTGADRGALNAAIKAGFPYGGWSPKGRLAEDGVIPAKYVLQEMASKDYLKRTEANVIDSDATLLFTYGPATGGSLRTLKFARQHQRPYEHINLATASRERAVERIVEWLSGNGENDYEDYQAVPPKPCVLNVAGSRGSKVPDIEQDVEAIILDLIEIVRARP